MCGMSLDFAVSRWQLFQSVLMHLRPASRHYLFVHPPNPTLSYTLYPELQAAALGPALDPIHLVHSGHKESWTVDFEALAMFRQGLGRRSGAFPMMGHDQRVPPDVFWC